MKKNSLTLIFCVLSVILIWFLLNDSSISHSAGNHTTAHFEDLKIDMGPLEFKKPQIATFKFRNVGSVPLIISNVVPGCGCTKASWEKHPVNPDKSGEIRLEYDAEYPGRFIKTIKVFCNVEQGVIELELSGEVAYDKNFEKLSTL